MKYKLIKKYPGSPELGYITKFNANKEDWGTPNMLLEDECINFPEYWEKFDDVMFISSDGVEMKKGMIVFIVYGNLYIAPLEIMHYNNPNNDPTFSTKELAEEFVKQKQKESRSYSYKDVEDILTKISSWAWGKQIPHEVGALNKFLKRGFKEIV